MARKKSHYQLSADEGLITHDEARGLDLAEMASRHGGAGRGQGRKPASMPAASPSPNTIRALRATAGLTQAQAAALVGAGMRAWMGWETPAGEPNARAMSPAVWFAFCARLALTPAELARVEAMMETAE